MLQAPHSQRDATGVHGEDEDESKLRNLGWKTSVSEGSRVFARRNRPMGWQRLEPSLTLIRL